MNDLKREHNAFYIVYSVCRAILAPFYRFRISGRDNIPEGAAIFCANHSCFIDPIFMCFALTKKRPLHFLAKAEIFKVPILRWILKRIGTFPVDRNTSDTASIRTSLRYLKAGERLGIFPEGTRVAEAYAVTAKRGAVRLADKTGAPLVPIYMPRNKRVFQTIDIIIGEPYYISSESKLTHEDYDKLSEVLMDKIEELGRRAAK